MAKTISVTSNDIIHFWFKEIEPKDWWVKNAAFDKIIKKRFQQIYQKAVSGELFNWRYNPLSSLAEIIILDQFPRNMFRDKKQSFASDALALCLAQNALDKEYDKKLEPQQKSFMYMPFMHSESKEIHKVAELIFSDPDVKGNLEFELKHKAIIDRFGRYPHRNKILGRKSTKEEIEFLSGPNSSF
jgi:uncharacterized protein (DUF924 family)